MMPGPTISRLLVPAGVLVALGVAVGVWLAPSSWLDPAPPRANSRLRAPTPEEIRPDRQSVPDRKDWLATADLLDTLRDPDPEPVEDEEVDPTTDPEGGETEPGVTIIEEPTWVPQGWTYEGFIEQPTKVAALIRIRGIQRFFFEGREMEADEIPGPITVLLAEVHRDHIILDINGVDHRIDRADVAPPVRAPDTTPRPRPRSQNS